MSRFRVRKTDDNTGRWTIANGPDYRCQNYINSNGEVVIDIALYDTEAEAQVSLDLYLFKAQTEMRQFDTGATRDVNDHPDKPSYYKALSPIVLREYVKYLGRHRTMSDGSKRNWDNWKSGIPIDVYMDGLMRHVMAVWLIQQGYKSYDNNGEVTIKDSLNGVLFNTMGFLHEYLKAEVEKTDE